MMVMVYMVDGTNNLNRIGPNNLNHFLHMVADSAPHGPAAKLRRVKSPTRHDETIKDLGGRESAGQGL